MDETRTRARASRQTLTPPEARLWVGLKRLRAEGFHFRRESPFRGYILDFVCNSSRLAVEVDGASHEHRQEHDRVRDGVLAREGYRTLRVPASAVRDNFEGVMIQIRAALAAED